MIAIIAWFPGNKDGMVLRQSRGSSCCTCPDCLPRLYITTPGLYRLDWPEDDESADPTVERLADLPAIPDVP